MSCRYPALAWRQRGPDVQDRVGEVYGRRFGEADARAKESLWAVLGAYLQRHVGESSVVLDLACDRGYFIRNIRAAERWATDVRDVSAELPKDVRFVQADSLELETALPIGHFDRVFISNFLEHLPGPDVVVRQLEVVHRLLRNNGRIIILQPNIRLARGSYWDFIDHRVALTEKSLQEAAELAGFSTREVVVRFLPYTTKSRLPMSPRLVRAYLAFRPAWFVLGKQSLYVGEKRA
jgi:SAM-dependent methyltransferase